MVRVSTRCRKSDTRRTTKASAGTPATMPVLNSASAGGGLILRPRLYQIAADWKMKLEESVAMIGGMRRRRISA